MSEAATDLRYTRRTETLRHTCRRNSHRPAFSSRSSPSANEVLGKILERSQCADVDSHREQRVPVGFGLTLYRHREHGSAVMLVKEQRSDRFGAGSRARRREHQPFGRSDVAVDTDEGMSQPIGALMNKSEGAVGPQIDLT